ncbi:hypothetical protein [Methylopila sp. M107]|uniref:hypothetical protein n=1 Tax=Methylopila sp. M107 TaxID=1101190 RepID=UPI000380C03D|nr:hypothetical protein [Methylopila sp. M107]
MPETPDGLDANALIEILKAIRGEGPIWMSVIAALGAVIIVAHRFGLLKWLVRSRTEVQAESFQERMLSALTAAHGREDALMAKLDAFETKYDALREEAHQGRFEVHMLRQQMKMFLQGLRQVKAGIVPIEALIEIGEGSGGA